MELEMEIKLGELTEQIEELRADLKKTARDVRNIKISPGTPSIRQERQTITKSIL